MKTLTILLGTSLVFPIAFVSCADPIPNKEDQGKVIVEIKHGKNGSPGKNGENGQNGGNGGNGGDVD